MKVNSDTSIDYVDTMYILMEMTTKIAKWGNSYAIRLPKETLDELSLKEGNLVIVSTDANSIRIKPTKKNATLGELISRINRNNKHDVVEWIGSKGNEIW